ncbi:MAG TPA: glycosyl hydrolase [Anaerovoracaceae bacterium]|nr:glycosyl hydrolase [Anaerovoracaceae bacterium]
MRKSIIAKTLCFGLSLGLLAGMADTSFAAVSTAKTETEITVNQEAESAAKRMEEAAKLKEAAEQKDAAAVKDLYSLGSDGTNGVFTNYVDGYSLKVDQGMLVDMGYSGVCTVLENDHKRIEIYKESLPSNVSQQAYISYSNQFLANSSDHTKEYETRTTIDGRTIHILQWSRSKLSRIENDKNYYVSFEILSGSKETYSIFVKSDSPFYLTGGYHYLVESFKTFAPTKSAYMRKTQEVSVESRGWNQETQDFYQQYFSPESTLQWGIFEPKAPDDFTQLNYLETAMEYQFPILLNYTNFDNKYKHPNLEYRLQNAYKNNKTLELTLQTSHANAGEGNMVYDVLNGEFDEFLRNYAATVSEFDHPVLFRLGNEMNGDWCPYSSYNTSKDTEIFKEFYRYVHQIFTEAEADNVIWVWNPNGKSFPDFQWNDAVMYYPGDEYVDIVGLTAYNTGTYYSGENWAEFAELYDPLYAKYTSLYNQPMMITEFGSSSVGGDKNQWIKNMFAHIEAYPEIKVAIWWNGCDWDANGNVARPYFIDETPEIVKTFKQLLNQKTLFWDVYA